ncbi:hypothetical protein FACS189427_08770 [Planctomycetales bacterium]|nr:hypothetical protein FACS189427_08770 [Planctomycetales bacterium]
MNSGELITNVLLSKFLVEGPWDVDNDGDGIADSIWLDAGLGTFTDPKTGKTYKKLVSYYVLDMDGRLNVNVHGNEEHLNAFDTLTPATGNGDTAVRGSSGTADIRLDLGLKEIKNDRFSALVQGIGTDLGRYNTDSTPGNAGLNELTTASQMYSKNGINAEAYSHPTEAAFGGRMPDLWGSLPLSFDALGNRSVTAGGNYYAGNPYMLNPYDLDDTPTAADLLLNVKELQYLLTSFGDSNYRFLSDNRLRNLLGDSNQEIQMSPYRLFLTALSSDIPVATSYFGPVRNSVSQFGSITQGFYGHISGNIFISGSISEVINRISNLFHKLPIEIQRGEKLNLNRLTLRSDWTFDYTSDPSHSELPLQLTAKSKFANELFYMLAVLCYDRIEKDGNYGGLTTKADAYNRLAQWAVNFVDFIDPDDIMTPLIYSTEPFTLEGSVLFDPFMFDDDGALGSGSLFTKVLESTITDNDLNNRGTNPKLRLIWGMEKPEVVIEKTFAVHNRRVADSINDNLFATGVTCACGADTRRVKKEGGPACTEPHTDTKFDQVDVPEDSLFIDIHRLGDSNRKHSLTQNTTYDNAPPSDNVINLAKKGPDGYYIWRLAISGKDKSKPSDTSGAKNVFEELKTKGMTYSFQPAQYTPGTVSGVEVGGETALRGNCSIAPDRFIWFGKNDANPKYQPANEIHFYNDDISIYQVKLEVNQHLVLFPRPKTLFKSKPVRTAAPANPSFCKEDGDADTYISMNDQTGTKKMVAHIDGMVNKPALSASGPATAYPLVGTSGTGSGDPYTNAEFPEFDGYGTIQNYKTIFLQRLADPTREHHPISNPYITVDWNTIDLHVINSEKDEDGADETEAMYVTASGYEKFKEPLKFAIRQWGYSNWKTSDKPETPNVWDRSFTETEVDGPGFETDSFAAKLDAKSKNGGSLALGRLPTEITAGTAVNGYDAPSTAYLHFPWNDAPFANSGEIMLIPTTSAARFGFEFHDNYSGTPNSGKWTDGASSSLGTTGMRIAYRTETTTTQGSSPYLNFFDDTLPSGTAGSYELVRLFDFVRVPSMFAGTIQEDWRYENQAAANAAKANRKHQVPIYAMREPGKINLNTATGPAWEALQGVTTREWNTYDDAAGLFNSRDAGTSGPSDFKPFRSPGAVTLVAPGDTVQNPLDATLFRKVGGNPLIPSQDTAPAHANPYTQLESVMRLMDITTTRSNVFAVWITIGYFEAEKFDSHTALQAKYTTGLSHINNLEMFNAVYPDGYVLGAEKGLDDGTVKRHRAFYLLDRSIPVGFRRGEVFKDKDDKPQYRDIILKETILE